VHAPRDCFRLFLGRAAGPRRPFGDIGVTLPERRAGAKKVTRARSCDAGHITSKPMLIGYARVSTVDQNLALQRDALTEAGCEKIFTEQMSGAVIPAARTANPPVFENRARSSVLKSLIQDTSPEYLGTGRNAKQSLYNPNKSTEYYKHQICAETNQEGRHHPCYTLYRDAFRQTFAVNIMIGECHTEINRSQCRMRQWQSQQETK
jgi:hypothetical protein